MKTRSETLQPREARVASATYQPLKAELGEKFDMPGWSLDQMRENPLGRVHLVQGENVTRRHSPPQRHAANVPQLAG